MKNFLLLFAMFFTAFFSFAQTPTDLFFSEYDEGSGNNKAVEIYNPTDQPIDLNSYYVARYSNGSTVYTGGGITHLSGMLQPYNTFVLVNGQTTSTSTSPACSPELQAMADMLDHDYPAPTYMNGNDAIALIKTPNGAPPTSTNVTPVDLIGQIGMGNAIASETGWSYVKDSVLTYSNSNGDPVTGQVINYIVQAKADDGVTYGPYWMSWTSDHSLIRKPNIVQGVVVNPAPFKVALQWDTLPGVLDTANGYFVYKDIWSNLGTHACVADPNYQAVDEFSSARGIKIYPNPVVSDYFDFSAVKPVKSVSLVDLLGREIHNELFASPRKEGKVRVGNSGSGVFLVKFVFSDNKAVFQKILIK